MFDVQEVRAWRGKGPDAKGLAALLEATRRAEEWAARRVLAGRIAIVASVPMAYLLFRGAGIDGPGARFVLALWLLAVGCLVGSAAAAMRAERLLQALLNTGVAADESSSMRTDGDRMP